jgi:hypothetical protein
MATNRMPMTCTPEDVFTVLSNGWLYPSWVVGASRVRDVDGTWPAENSSIHHSFGVWPVLIDDATTILEWDPPRHAMFKARGWPVGSARVVIDIERAETGCTVTIHEDATEGPGQLIPKPVRTILIHVRNTESLQRLRYLAEGNADRV